MTGLFCYICLHRCFESYVMLWNNTLLPYGTFLISSTLRQKFVYETLYDVIQIPASFFLLPFDVFSWPWKHAQSAAHQRIMFVSCANYWTLDSLRNDNWNIIYFYTCQPHSFTLVIILSSTNLSLCSLCQRQFIRGK